LIETIQQLGDYRWGHRAIGIEPDERLPTGRGKPLRERSRKAPPSDSADDPNAPIVAEGFLDHRPGPIRRIIIPRR
jgi:hypothetical protein